MIFEETPLKGAYVISLEKHEDERGFFARTFCKEEFLAHGLSPEIAQCSVSYNKRAGTLRGMHYQKSPHEEIKLVRCISGKIYDVIVDIRDDSPTYKKWFGVELSAENFLSIYIPKGFAHGFMTLSDDSAILYDISEPYFPDCVRGFNYADATVGIRWPHVGEIIISEKDKDNPCLE
ncbi:MAG: dTDP-4-dehydrorhamnose 3,5-epimerase [Synergistaceae bacterium]|jgi:dTDP-4-dehydrorhamnose 3,5-epimerase|nr:dTDP-4-dehydrorhamnose 3,5-epimerase [Synergistaceae bacterium]